MYNVRHCLFECVVHSVGPSDYAHQVERTAGSLLRGKVSFCDACLEISSLVRNKMGLISKLSTFFVHLLAVID